MEREKQRCLGSPNTESHEVFSADETNRKQGETVQEVEKNGEAKRFVEVIRILLCKEGCCAGGRGISRSTVQRAGLTSSGEVK